MKGTKKIEQYLFYHDSGKADVRVFRTYIAAWLSTATDKRPTWNQLLDEIVLKRNAGKELKYCYYSNRHGRIMVSKKFQDWAARAADEIKTALKRIHA
jgi:hypothetical protein